jgi:hypothetical protein
MHRPIAVLLAASLCAVPANAQQTDLFRNGWFWGAKAGVTNLSTDRSASTSRPTFGLEWLITRRIGALQVFGDYTDVDLTGSVRDPSAPGGRRAVQFSNLRRFGFAALAFPRTFGPLRPYGGIGLSLNVIGRARAVPDTVGGTVDRFVEDRVEDARSRATVLVTAGVHAQFSRVATFAQFSWLPPYRDFLINDRSIRMVELGVRYNVGSSMDRPGRRR